MPKCQEGKNKTGDALGASRRVWREGGGPLELGAGCGPGQEVFAPHRDPTGLGSPPGRRPLRAVVTGSLQPRPPPGAPQYLAPPPAFVLRSAHQQCRRGSQPGSSSEPRGQLPDQLARELTPVPALGRGPEGHWGSHHLL